MSANIERQFKFKKGWLQAAKCCVSPNHSSRPTDEVSLLVIHNISLPPGQFGGDAVARFFTNNLDPCEHPYFTEISGLCVSSHFLIDREGNITQFVALQDKAWHAGESCFQERENCNDFSIGIELEGTDTLPYTEDQYQILAQLTVLLQQRYPLISNDRIVGHADIAPGRKTDPGASFDWEALFAKLSLAHMENVK